MLKSKLLIGACAVFLIIISEKCSGQNWLWVNGPQAIYNNDPMPVAEGYGITTDDSGDVFLWGDNSFDQEVYGTDTIGNNTHPDVLSKFDAAGNIKWAKTIGGNGTVFCTKICADHVGNVYATGILSTGGTAVFDSYVLNPNVTDTFGHGRFFLAKYDKNGNVVFAKKFGGKKDWLNDMAMNNNGEIFVGGRFDTSSYTIGNITIQGDSLHNIFIAKYSSDGNIIWVKSAGGNYPTLGGADYISEIAPDNSGNCYITGNFRSPQLTFNSTVLTNPELLSTFFAKYDNAGNLMWAQSANGYAYTPSQHITTDWAGNIYMAGNRGVDSTLTWGTYTLHFFPFYLQDNFLLKFNPSGNIIWGMPIYGGSIYQIDCDSKNNVYIGGSFEYNLFFNPINIKFDTTILNYPAGTFWDPMYVAKFSPYGQFLCASTLSSGGDDMLDIEVDANDDVVVGGDYLDTLYIEGVDSITAYTTPHPGTGPEQLFVAKYRCDLNDAVTETKATNSINIYPNPARESVTVTAENISRLQITNLLGQVVLNENYTNAKSEVKLNASVLSQGIYFLTVTAVNKTITQKLIIQR